MLRTDGVSIGPGVEVGESVGDDARTGCRRAVVTAAATSAGAGHLDARGAGSSPGSSGRIGEHRGRKTTTDVDAGCHILATRNTCKGWVKACPGAASDRLIGSGPPLRVFRPSTAVNARAVTCWLIHSGGGG